MANCQFCIDFFVVFSVIFIAKAASVLQSRLLGDRNQWTSAVMTWNRLQGELADRRTTVDTPSTALGVTRKREEGRGGEERREEEERCSVESRESTGEQREEENGNRRQASGEQNGAQTLGKKRKGEKEERGVERVSDGDRKREKEASGQTCVEGQTLEKKRKKDDDEEEEEEEKRGTAQDFSSEKNVEKEKTSEREKRSEGEEERGMVMEFSSCRKNGKHGVTSGTDFSGHATPGQDHNVESSSRRMDDMAKDFAAESVDNGNNLFLISTCISSTFKVNVFSFLFLFISCLPPCNKVKTTAGRDKTPLPPSRIKPEPPSVPVSFRISCKCTGSLSRYFSTQVVEVEKHTTKQCKVRVLSLAGVCTV